MTEARSEDSLRELSGAGPHEANIWHLWGKQTVNLNTMGRFPWLV